MRFSDLLQFHGARITAHLPDRVLRWLSGEPPLEADGVRFDAHAQFLRNFRRKRHRFGLVQPDVDAGRRRYRHETSAFRGRVTEVGNVCNLAVDGLRMRHYTPPAASRDLLVYLHGGGFAIGDLDTHDEPCRILCRHANTHLLSVDYRLAPEHKFPAALDDTAHAFAFAQSLGVERISIGGDSAGANLATVTARGAFAQLLIYPVTDSLTHRRSYDLFGEGHFLTMIDREEFRLLYTGGTGFTGSDPRISPLHGDLTDHPPALVVTAGFDLLRDEGEAYAEALEKAGNVVRTLRVPTLGHGFIHLTGISRTARKAMLRIAAEWRTLLDR
jgi:acetyl esterase